MIRAWAILVAAALASPLVSSPADAVEGFTLAVTPPAFSPDGDGRKDSATIAVQLPGPGQVTIRILAGADEVRRWDEGTDGGLELQWDGTDQGGGLVPDGTYTVEATSTDLPEAEPLMQLVRIDTADPRVSWEGITPSPATGRRALAFSVRVSDAAPTVSITLRAADMLGTVDEYEEEITPGSRTIGWRPKSGGRTLYPGTYRVNYLAQDDAGNRARSTSRPFRIERSVRARVFRRLSGTGRRVAITIDDCHYRSAWSSMLRTLRRARVTATFFCPGDRMRMFPDLVRKTVKQGHVLASHGWDHGAMAGGGTRSAIRKLKRDRATAWSLARVTTAPYFRPPYGSYDQAVVRAAGKTGHGRIIMWDVTTGDTSGAGSDAIVRNAVRGSRKGSIILMHTVDRTARALPGIIRGLKARGLRPVGLPKLFRSAGYR